MILNHPVHVTNSPKTFHFLYFILFLPEVVSCHFGVLNQLIKGLDKFRCQHKGQRNLCPYCRCQPLQPFLICLWPWVTTLNFSELTAKHHSSTLFSPLIHRAKTTAKVTFLVIKSSFRTTQTHGRGNIRNVFSYFSQRSATSWTAN